MLMNNLDPEVAEKPARARRLWRHRPRRARLGELRPHRRRAAARSKTTRRCCVQSGKPVGVFRTHADAPRVLIANSNLVPHWATWDHFNELDRKGLMMYGQMTAGSWIYIGTQGIVQGTYETFVELGPPALRRRPRRPLDPDRRARRHGRRAAARRDHGRRLAARGRVPAVAHRDAARDRLSRRAGRGPRRGAGDDRARLPRAQGRSRSACSATPPRSFRSWCAAASGPTPSPTRPRRTIRSTAICRRAGRSPNGRSGASSDPEGGRARRQGSRWRVHVRAMLDFSPAGVPTLDYGNNIRQMAQGDGRRRRLRLSRASCRPISARCSAAASGRSAGRRCRAIPRTSTAPTPR